MRSNNNSLKYVSAFGLRNPYMTYINRYYIFQHFSYIWYKLVFKFGAINTYYQSSCHSAHYPIQLTGNANETTWALHTRYYITHQTCYSKLTGIRQCTIGIRRNFELIALNFYVVVTI